MCTNLLISIITIHDGRNSSLDWPVFRDLHLIIKEIAKHSKDFRAPQKAACTNDRRVGAFDANSSHKVSQLNVTVNNQYL